MARIFDTLRKGDTARRAERDRVPAPRPFRPEPEPQADPEPAEEVHYIEVGGKNSPVDASPSVLACAAPALSTSRNRHDDIPEPSKSQPIAQAEKPVIGFTFSPLPLEAIPLRPVKERFVPSLIVLHQPEHPVSAQYRALAEALTKQFPAREPQVLLFSATETSIDTVNVVLNLALARAGLADSRILVVDVHLHRPAIAERLGLSLAPGLQDVLGGKIALRRALQETGVKNLLALTAGRPLEDGSHLLARDAMRSVLRHLRERFDWILIAAPCWDGRPDVVSVGAASDAVYLLLPESKAGSSETAALQELIREQGSNLKGCILLRAA